MKRKMVELQAENDVLMSRLKKRNTKIETELTRLREDNAKYKQTIQQLKEQVAQKAYECIGGTEDMAMGGTRTTTGRAGTRRND